MLTLALVGALLVSARRARAELDLRWEAPPTCPQQDEVFERIRRLAGTALDQTEKLSVEGSIAPANGRYRLTLVVRTGSEERNRVIESDSCADLAGAAAITVALLLGVDASTLEAGADGALGTGDSGADTSKQGAKGGTEEQRETTKPPPVVHPPPEPADDSSRNRWAVVLRAPIAAFDLGPLPRPVFGLGLGGGLRYDTWRIVLTGRASLAQSVSASGPDGDFGADLQRLTGELVTCWGFRSSSLRFEVAPCVGVAIEHLNARGFGESVSPTSQRTTWLAPGAGLAGHWYAMESLAFFVGVTGYVELSRPVLVVEGLGEVAQLKPVALGATIGVEWIL